MNINIDAGRHLETYLDKAAKKGETLPFTLNVGVGPGVHFAAATPSEAAPIDTDELGIASAFQGAPLELVPSTQSDGRDDRARDVRARMRDGAGRGRRRGAVRRGHRLLRQARAAPGGPRQGDPPPQGSRCSRPSSRASRSGTRSACSARRTCWRCSSARCRASGTCYFSHGGCGFYHCVVAHAAGARRLVEAGDHGDLRRLPAAQDGDRGRRRRRHPQPDGRRMGDDHPARSARPA